MRLGAEAAGGEETAPAALSREALRALRALTFQCPANRRAILGDSEAVAERGETLPRSLVAALGSADPEAALHASALIAELTSESDPPNDAGVEFRRGFGAVEGVAVALLRLIRDGRWDA